MRIIKALIDLLYPSFCCSCGQPSEKALCPACAGKIRYVENPLICPRSSFSSARALAEYSGVVKDSVHAFKYANARRMSDQFAGLMQERMDTFIMGADLITFVPLRRAKRRQRGYNQAELLARALARRCGKKAYGTLEATRFIKDQSKLSAAERPKNVRGAYKMKDMARGRLKGKSVLLVDDVYTTGATAAECSRILKKTGAKEIKVLTLART